MLIAIDVTDARPIYVQIMDEVRRARVLGTLHGDEPLPSVRHLAAELRVNPNTVQQAYRELEREGLVYVRRGQGTFASPHEVQQDTARRELLRAVAERALHEAHRHGVDAEALVKAIREAATTNSTKEQA
jgi:GntR family transcriptional regulator